MALSLAIPLSGLEMSEFRGIRRILGRSETPPMERAISPSSRSDSSGISSLTTLTDIVTPSLSPISRPSTPSDDGHHVRPVSRRRVRHSSPARRQTSLSIADLSGFRKFQRFIDLPSAPQACQRTIQPIAPPSAMQESCRVVNQKIIYGNRDILNLGANLRSPFWLMKITEVPNNNVSYFVENRSIHHRIGDYGLIEAYPTTYCRDCDFGEPSPFTFHELRC